MCDNNKKIKKYLDNLIKEPFEIQTFLRKAELIRNDICPSIGKNIGSFLKFLIQITDSKDILEIGTSVGYSTLWLISSSKNIIIDTIEVNEKLINEAKKNIKNSKVSNKINFHLGLAEKIIPNIKKKFDLIFVDSSTKSYFEVFEECISHLKNTGIIVFEDIFFSCIGKRKNQRKLMSLFVKKVLNDGRIISSILKIDDGLLLCKKINKKKR